ncbi:MAG: hypothetical protein HJJLKODD_00212 [Phycisphaerae bacterium]|nr:hypothetical protein [Phycisphaerae bacterium]
MTKSSTGTGRNHLRDALSPYLLQHADNPVDWYPWGTEALARARQDNRPIFLSIGYSACHWCHVMAHECFEDEEVAAMLREHFISIKVDREERPEVDEIYMQATMAMNNGQGGWPMSVFLTPAGVPFYAGTYFPKTHFMQLLPAVAQAYSQQPNEIAEVARQVQEALHHWAAGPPVAANIPPADWRDQQALLLVQHFDHVEGGLASGRNKFPPSQALELFMRSDRHQPQPELLQAVRLTLDRMAAGGIHDHLGGGFCRYSTDPQWLVPHFEKMLYDQALISNIYLDGYQQTGESRYAEVAAGVFDYVAASLTDAGGGFYSAQDADSEGLEGKYYVWTQEEIGKVLAPAEAQLFMEYYGVSASGNWDEPFGHAPLGPKNILHITQPLAEVAARHGRSLDDAQQLLAGARQRLRQVRQQRVPPVLDDKILVDWNGLMIASLARGGVILNEPRYLEMAIRAADYILSRHVQDDGRLLRCAREGRVHLAATLSDYTFLVSGLLNLFEATLEMRWLAAAERLTEITLQDFWDEERGGYFFTAHQAETLITRSKNPHDGAVPSGNSVGAMNLLRLAEMLERPAWRRQAEQIFTVFAPIAERSVGAFDYWLCALDFYHSPVRRIALRDDPSAEARKSRQFLWSKYMPDKVIAPMTVGSDTALNGSAWAQICMGQKCLSPIQTFAEFLQALEE